MDGVDQDRFYIVPSVGRAMGQICVDRVSSDSGVEVHVEFVDYKRQCVQNGLLNLALGQGITTLEELLAFCEDHASYDGMTYTLFLSRDVTEAAEELRELSFQMERDMKDLDKALSSSVEESAHGRRDMKHRAVEKIHGVNERDSGVKMITFAQANKGRSLEDFAEKARNLSWIKSMPDTEAQCMIAFGCAVLAKLSGIKRIDVWDFIFGGPGSTHIVSDKEAHKILLNTYYDKTSTKPELDGVVSGMYHYWHDTPMASAIRDTYRRTRSQDAAYMAGVCASGGALDDEGNLHFLRGLSMW